MSKAIGSEFRKFFTTRLWWGMLIAIVVAGAAFAALFAFLFTSEAVVGEGGPGIPTSDAELAGPPSRVASASATCSPWRSGS